MAAQNKVIFGIQKNQVLTKEDLTLSAASILELDPKLDIRTLNVNAIEAELIFPKKDQEEKQSKENESIKGADNT